MAVIFRCANEVVVFRIRRKLALVPGTITCINDGTVVAQLTGESANLVQSLRSMAQKAVSLGGAIQQVVDIAELQ